MASDRQRIVHSTDPFATADRTLADSVGDRRSLVVYTPAVKRFDGRRLHRCLTEHCPRGFDVMLLSRPEDSKTLIAVEVCKRAAAEVRLHRTSLWDTLTAVCEHPDSALNLCLPASIGAHTLIGLQDFDIAVLQRARARLKTGQIVARRPPADARVL